MPLVGQYTWSERPDRVVLSVPLKGCAPSKVDLFCTSRTLKVNFAPYLLDLVLHSSINAFKHKATVKDGTLLVTLFKQVEGVWGTLLVEPGSEAEVRASAVTEHEKLQRDMQEQRRDRKVDDERFSLRKQMSIEEAERSRLENVKAEEKETAERHMYATFAEMQSQQAQAKEAAAAAAAAKKADNSNTIFDSFLSNDDIDTEGEEEGEEEEEATTEGKSSSPLRPGDSRVEELSDSSDDDEANKNSKGAATKAKGKGQIFYESSALVQPRPQPPRPNHHQDDDKEVRFVPPPRVVDLGLGGEEGDASSSGAGGARVGIRFTPRVFPTPMRESKAAEEEDWVVKNRRHLKQHGVLGKGAARDVSEEDATWLKAKGDDFFRGGDARSAVSAYSAAIDADTSMTSCYSNRSACYLKLGQFADCRADCSSAIEQLDAASSLQQRQHNSSQEANARAQLHKLLLRRAVSSCHLGDYAAAIADQSRVLAAVEALHSVGLDSGLGAATTPATVMADLKMLRLLADADALKKQGDAVFAERRVDEAKGCYDQALSLVPLHVGCLSNRSACKLALGDVQGCVDDCSHALELLQIDPGASASSSTSAQGGLNMLAAVLPPAGSDKRLAWVTRTVARRGQALAQLNRLPEAAEDFRRAAALNPANDALKEDLVKIEAALRAQVCE